MFAMTRATLIRPLVLASASPRRRELLAQLGLQVRVLPGGHEESPPAPGEDILRWVRTAALDKARAATMLLPPTDAALVVGADTAVLLPTGDDRAPRWRGRTVTVLGKPRDAGEARRMLRALSGRAHLVVSAFALLAHPEGEAVIDAVATRVVFRALTAPEIDAYVDSGEPLDKAGAYGIQGLGAVFVDKIVGDYYTVVGLPLARLWTALSPWRA
jgi:septum formation protein